MDSHFLHVRSSPRPGFRAPQTNLTNFTGTAYRNVSRSYFEFQQLYDALTHNNPQTIVPALPLAQTSAPTDEEDDRLVKIMLQRWFTRVCEDMILVYDEELRSFIESDFGYQPTPRPKRKISSGFSLMRRHVPDEDEELQLARFELTKLEGQFFDSAKALDRVSLARKCKTSYDHFSVVFVLINASALHSALSVAHAEMGNKLVNVATTETHPPIANAMRKLGRTWHTLADLDQAQAISECVILSDSLGYQGLNARSAKETLQQRTSVLEEYQAAVKSAISKRRHIERLKASANIRPEKVDEALEDLEEVRYSHIHDCMNSQRVVNRRTNTSRYWSDVPMVSPRICIARCKPTSALLWMILRRHLSSTPVLQLCTSDNSSGNSSLSDRMLRAPTQRLSLNLTESRSRQSYHPSKTISSSLRHWMSLAPPRIAVPCHRQAFHQASLGDGASVRLLCRPNPQVLGRLNPQSSHPSRPGPRSSLRTVLLFYRPKCAAPNRHLVGGSSMAQSPCSCTLHPQHNLLRRPAAPDRPQLHNGLIPTHFWVDHWVPLIQSTALERQMGTRRVGAMSIRLVHSVLPICPHLCECSQRGRGWMRGRLQASWQTCSEAHHARF